MPKEGEKMIQEGFRDAVFEFAKRASAVEGVEYIILFGSLAKGEADRRSDIDIAVVFDTIGSIEDIEERREISEIALDIEAEFDRSIQLVITNRNFCDLDSYFVNQLLTEGIVLYGKSMYLESKGIKVRPYIILRYSLEGLSQTDKTRLKRTLYGQETKKEYKGKTYTTRYNGLLEGKIAEKLGPAVMLIPKENEGELKETLDAFGVKYEVTEVWKTSI